MASIIFGVIVLGLLLMAMNTFANVDPRKLAPVVKMVGGVGALGGAVFLAARGELSIALPLGAAGLSLLGFSARRKARGRRLAYAPHSSKWSSITTPA